MHMRFVLALCLWGTGLAAETTGPKEGTLVVVGGGRMGHEIVREFIDAAGGIDQPFVILPTALEGEDWGDSYRHRSFLMRAGARDVTVLHTRDPQIANTDEFQAPLIRARGVWIDGGRQWRLADAYQGTKTEQALHAVLARGGVIGGSSAGATIQGSYLVRGAPEGNQIMMAPGHEVGFGFVRNCAVDQHVIARLRQDDLAPVIAAHPELLGLGIDEGTAIIVRGGHLRVVGTSAVLIHHRSLSPQPDGKSYEMLWAGGEYDLPARRIVKAVPPSPPSARRLHRAAVTPEPSRP
ncbi:MAG: peptidase S51 [Planctomycetota bacterium]|nr:MAG: peptidase S51 [Planctomycetota bacterium]